MDEVPGRQGLHDDVQRQLVVLGSGDHRPDAPEPARLGFDADVSGVGCGKCPTRVLTIEQIEPVELPTQHLTVDVSIIYATHRNLRDMIDRQGFRENLFYRLNGLTVRLPPLRERSDLLALVRRKRRGKDHVFATPRA